MRLADRAPISMHPFKGEDTRSSCFETAGGDDVAGAECAVRRHPLDVGRGVVEGVDGRAQRCPYIRGEPECRLRQVPVTVWTRNRARSRLAHRRDARRSGGTGHRPSRGNWPRWDRRLPRERAAGATLAGVRPLDEPLRLSGCSRVARPLARAACAERYFNEFVAAGFLPPPRCGSWSAIRCDSCHAS